MKQAKHEHQAPWCNHDIAESIQALVDAGAEVFEVGGPVRDRIMGRPLKDHDLLCRHLSIDDICKVLKPYGKVAKVGKSFGVIKFSPHRRSEMIVDIALPRKETSTGVGHRDFSVDFDPELPVEEDLGRRDFTINAMAFALKEQRLIDPYQGMQDLAAGILRMVFPQAFEEDPLRLVRAVQFAARFGLTIEPETWEAMRASAELITTVSGERIALELAKLLSAPKPSHGFRLLAESGLLHHLFPELVAIRGVKQDKQPGDDVFEHTMRALDAAASDTEVEHRGNLELLLAVLFHDIGKAKTARYHPPSRRIVFFSHQLVSKKLAKKIIDRFKLAGIGINPQQVLHLIEHHMFQTRATATDRAIRRFIAKIGEELIFLLMDLRLADNRGGKHPHGIKGVVRLRKRIREELAKEPPFGPADLAINGHDLMQAGIPEGPMIGKILGELVECVLDEPAHNTREQLLALVQKMREHFPPETGDSLQKGKKTSKKRPHKKATTHEGKTISSRESGKA